MLRPSPISVCLSNRCLRGFPRLLVHTAPRVALATFTAAFSAQAVCIQLEHGLFLSAMKWFLPLYICLATAISQQHGFLAMDSGAASYLFDGYKPTTRRKATIACRSSLPVEVTIEQGEAVFEYAKKLVTPAALEASVMQGTLRLPNGLWLFFFSRHCQPALCQRIGADVPQDFPVLPQSLNKWGCHHLWSHG